MTVMDTPSQICSFYIGDRLFGVNILDVREVCAEVLITPIHHAPEAVRGYINIRGQVYLVIDLGTYFGFSNRPIDHNSRVIIFKPTVGESFCILVDRIAGVVEVANNDIVDRRDPNQKTNQGNVTERRKSESALIQGVCRLNNGLMVVLNSNAILDDFKPVGSKQ